MDDEILVKGTDGQWYILRGEELTPYEEQGLAGFSGVKQGLAGIELPKGVSEAVYQKMEHKDASPVQKGLATLAPKKIPASIKQVQTYVQSAPSELSLELEKLIDETSKTSGVVFNDQNLAKRFKILVSARLRDVRDEMETKEIMVRNVKVGGLGMSQADASKVSGVLENKFKEFNEKWKAVEAKKMAELKQKQAEESARREADKEKSENEELDKKRHMLLAKAGVVEKHAPYRNEVSGAGFKVSAKGGSASGGESSKLKVVEDKKPSLAVEEKTKKAAVPVFKPIQKPKIQTKQEKPVVVKKVASVVVPDFRSPRRSLGEAGRDSGSPVDPLRHSVSEARTQATVVASASRPKVVDVKYAPRLLSPLEELKEMRLIDFRRLARDPADATLKIRAKIDLLGEESFSKKMAGVEAWKQSEPGRLFFALSAEAIAGGKPVEAVIAEHEAKKELTLTSEEFHAIMELNKTLRF